MSADDHEEIRELIARYAHYFDTGRAEEWAELFTEDGRMALGDNPPTVGHQNLLEMAKNAAVGGSHHYIVNEVIDVDGDRATCECSLLLSRGQPPTFAMAGRYHDELVKVGGHWRFQSRSVTLDG